MPIRLRLVPSALVATAALSAGVVATGCGSDDFSPNASIAKAAEATAAVSGMRFTIDETVNGAHATGTGFMDARSQRSRMVLKTGGVSVIVLTDGFVMYEQLPEDAAKQLGTDKPWVRIDLAQAAKAQGIDYGALSGAGAGAGAGQQREQLEQLKATSDVKEVGHDTVRGVSTTHYSGTLDINRIADAVAEKDRAGAERSVKTLKAQLPEGVHTFPVDVWIDADNRMRRVAEEIETKAGTLDYTMELYDFGSREAIAFPGKDDVEDITDKLVAQSD
jgi:hypothetical protein